MARNVASTTLYLDDGSSPILNVAHQFPSGVVNISAGANPSQGFSVTPVAVGNSQQFSGPNILVSNVLSVPNQFNVGTANVANALSVVGPSTLTGPLTATGNVSLVGNTTISGSANVVSNLSVGSTVFVPSVVANAISTSGAASNVYIETRSSFSSNSSALYFGPTWRVKEVLSNGTYLLALQTLVNGVWTNSQVFTPPNITLSVASILNALV